MTAGPGPEGMTAEQHREVFTGSIDEWLRLNGVTFADPDEWDPIVTPPFSATIDLNTLKVGMAELIRAFGGEYH